MFTHAAILTGGRFVLFVTESLVSGLEPGTRRHSETFVEYSNEFAGFPMTCQFFVSPLQNRRRIDCDFPTRALCAADSSSLHQPRCSILLCEQASAEGYQTFHSCLVYPPHPALFPQQPWRFLPSYSGSMQRLLHQPKARSMPGTWNVSHFSAAQEGGRPSSAGQKTAANRKLPFCLHFT